MTPAELLKVYSALDNSRKVQPLRIVLVEEQAPGAALVLLDRVTLRDRGATSHALDAGGARESRSAPLLRR
jgi:hypothetical protein